MTEDIIGWALVFGLPILVGAVVIYFVRRSVRKAAEAAAKRAAAIDQLRQSRVQMYKKFESEDKDREALRKHPNYGHSRFDPKNPDTLRPDTIADNFMTAMILNQALSSSSGTVHATVDRDYSGAIKSFSMSSPSDDDTPSKTSSWSSSSPSSSSDWSSDSSSSSSSSWD